MTVSIKKLISSFFIILIVSACDNSKQTDEQTSVRPVKVTPIINYSKVAKYPHDINLYTEGLLFHDQKLFESTGYTEQFPQTFSAFGINDLKTGKFEKKAEIDKTLYFGEGIVFLKNKIYQLTYKNQIGFIYDAKTFKNIGQFSYANKEGWGMTTEGTNIIFSDGSCNLTFMNPEDFKVIKTLAVTENGYGVYYLNELEYIKGFIYANIYLTNRIVKIDPITGEVVGELNMDQLANESKLANPYLGEMNGIAYDSINDKILVTGKLWPDIYEISFPH